MEPPSINSSAQKSGADRASFPPKSSGLPAFQGNDFPHDEPPPDLEVVVEERRWRASVRNVEAVVRRAADAATRHAARKAGLDEGALPSPDTVVLSSDRVVKRLNARHRNRNKPTNVLTFEPHPDYGGGDIVLAYETVCREARAAGRSTANHLAHLIVHGVLHLDGHDHHQAGDARRMEMEEARILSDIGVPNPWKPRQPSGEFTP